MPNAENKEPTNQDIIDEIRKLRKSNRLNTLVFDASVAIAGLLVAVGSRLYGWGVFGIAITYLIIGIYNYNKPLSH